MRRRHSSGDYRRLAVDGIELLLSRGTAFNKGELNRSRFFARLFPFLTRRLEKMAHAPTGIVVVQNWFEELKRPVPVGK